MCAIRHRLRNKIDNKSNHFFLFYNDLVGEQGKQEALADAEAAVQAIKEKNTSGWIYFIFKVSLYSFATDSCKRLELYESKKRYYRCSSRISGYTIENVAINTYFRDSGDVWNSVVVGGGGSAGGGVGTGDNETAD